MKTIKDLSVNVTYRVGLGDLEVSEKVFEQLNEIADNGVSIDGTGMDYPEANEWLKDNIKERDCCDLEYEIEELS
jgi:hypothetical protein